MEATARALNNGLSSEDRKVEILRRGKDAIVLCAVLYVVLVYMLTEGKKFWGGLETS